MWTVFPHVWGVCMAPPPLLRISSRGAAFVEMGLIGILAAMVGTAGIEVPAGPRCRWLTGCGRRFQYGAQWCDIYGVLIFSQMHGSRGPADSIDIQPVFLGELALREVAFPLSKVAYKGCFGAANH